MFDIPPLLLQIALALPVLTALQLLVLNLIDRNARAARIGRPPCCARQDFAAATRC